MAKVCASGFSLTPYLESFTPTFGLGTPVFPRISSNLHCGTPTFSKRCLWDSYFQNPSENPVHEVLVNRLGGLSLPRKSVVRLTDCPNMTIDVYRGCKTTI